MSDCFTVKANFYFTDDSNFSHFSKVYKLIVEVKFKFNFSLYDLSVVL